MTSESEITLEKLTDERVRLLNITENIVTLWLLIIRGRRDQKITCRTSAVTQTGIKLEIN